MQANQMRVLQFYRECQPIKRECYLCTRFKPHQPIRHAQLARYSCPPNKFYRECQPIKWECYLSTRSGHGSLRVLQGKKLIFTTMEIDFYHRGNWFLPPWKYFILFYFFPLEIFLALKHSTGSLICQCKQSSTGQKLTVKLTVQHVWWELEVAEACGPDKTLAQMLKHKASIALLHLSPNSSIHSGWSTVTALLSVTEERFSAHEHGQELCAVFFHYQPLTVSLISHS